MDAEHGISNIHLIFQAITGPAIDHMELIHNGTRIERCYLPFYLPETGITHGDETKTVYRAVTRQAARQRRATVPLPGALPTTPPPISSPWNDFRTPREEQSPTTSEAETSVALIPSSPSCSSESSNNPESSSSEDELVISHQINPEKRSLGAYHKSTVSANQKSMSATLAFNPEAEDKRPLAEVRITKLKECPMLTEGRMDDYLFQQWSIACHRYQKHSGKKPAEIVAYVADGMLDPRFVAWYHTNQSRIDAMTLDEYLEEFQKFALPCNW
ncbi:hypothetical protein H2248_008736 [Termitomyces sp. 'cryptogamus']|nr:hypothetical protein H2248_008736 [Termitomyces sp. 'cryptogamus']